MSQRNRMRNVQHHRKSSGTKKRTLNIFGNTKALVFIIFALAFIMRLIYLVQISDTPYFENPAGDSKFIFERSQEIVSGDIIGKDINFHSSPAYSYFMALIFRLSKNSFFVLGLIQILIGSANCLLVFLLAKKMTTGRKVPAFIAGVMAALYGILAFFDADILGIFFTLIFVDIALLLLLKSRQSSRTGLAFLAGIALGCAALDRVNILLFVPVAAWFLASEYSLKWKMWKWKPAVIFIMGTVIMIFPVTVRNYLVGNDLVLISSNAGVNLYIGNNPQAVGVFYLPPESGLSNYDLQGSSVEVAERESGSTLKPSHVSHFWAKKARTFVLENPSTEAALIWRKFLLLLNFYEIPNHLNFYYVRSKFAPILYIMFVGFWFIAPIAIVGIVWRWRRKLGSHDKLLIGFLITYMLSLLPFFITARYRLPMVPILIAYASVTIVEIFDVIKRRKVKNLIWLGIGLSAVALFVNLPRMQFKYNRQRIIIGTRYIKRALENPQVWYNDFYKAIIELKWAIETEPFDPHAHYQLGKAYASIGYYSGAIREWEETLNIDPEYSAASQVLQIVRERFKNKGDIVSAAAIPETPFEEARSLTAQKHFDFAGDMYRKITREDPFHFQAWSDLGTIFFERERYDEAIHVYYQGLRVMPNNVLLLYGLARTYYRIGETETAKQLLEQCLQINPNNMKVLELLQLLEQ